MTSRKIVSCQENTDQQWRCPRCNTVGVSYISYSKHLRNCRKKFMLGHQKHYEKMMDTTDDGGSDSFTFDDHNSVDHSTAGKQPSDRYHTGIQNFQETQNTEMAFRSTPQEQVLGYDNTMLYSRSSLSEQAKAIVSKAKRNETDKNFNNSESDESSLESETGHYAELPGIHNDGDSDDDSNFSVTPYEVVEGIGDDDILTGEDDLVDEWEEYKNIANVSHMKVHTFPKPYPVGSLPKVYVAFLDLINILDSHQDSALKTFDQVVTWAVTYSTKYPGVFSNLPPTVKKTRETFLKAMRKLFNEKQTVPTVVDTKLPSGKIATVPTFDFEQSVLDLLHDEKIIPDNLCRENCNHETWMQKVPIRNTTRKDDMVDSHSANSHIRLEVEQEAKRLSKSKCPKIDKSFKGTKIEVLSGYSVPGDDSSTKKMIWWTCTVNRVIKKPHYNSPACVNVTWAAIEDIGWRSEIEEDIFLHTRLWNKTEEHSWRYCHVELPKFQNDSNTIETSLTVEELAVPVADLYTGAMMTRGISRFIGTILPMGIDIVRPLAIQLFIDASHSDLFGSLTLTPIQATLCVYNAAMRRKSSNTFVIAFLPSMKVGEGRRAGKMDLEMYVKGRARRPIGEAKTPTSVSKLKDFHALLDVGFMSFNKCCKAGGFVVEQKSGKKILYKPFIPLIIGDTAGNNELLCHYNCSGNRGICCPMNKCRCTGPELNKVPPQCHFISSMDIQKSLTDTQFAKSISQHQIRSALSRLPIADMIRGPMAITPFENLHAFYTGIFAYVTRVIHDMIGSGDKNARVKDFLDQLHQRISQELKRNSDRDFPLCPTRFGCFDLTRLTGNERVGTLFVFLVLLHTRQGHNAIKPFLQRAGIKWYKLVHTIQILLSFERWTKGSSTPREEVVNCSPTINELATMILENIPRKKITKIESFDELPNHVSKKSRQPTKKQKRKGSVNSTSKLISTGNNGWCIPKFHSIFYTENDMQDFGSAQNKDGEAGEEGHKDTIKKHAKRTNRTQSSFGKQVATRYGESTLVRKLLSKVNAELLIAGGSPVKDRRHSFSAKGTYTMELEVSADYNSIFRKIYWHDRKKG